jgi:cation diffusion facilitator CzcD-associated flavoprotein CzcO
MSTEHVDVLIVGAGLSGIGAACHLQRECPDKSFVLLESREVLGGTWDLFRYPGVRSDSDMYTLGYDFKPWNSPKAIADGPAILDYVRDTAREHGIDAHIRYGHRVERAEWSSATARWTVTVRRSGADAAREVQPETITLTCSFLSVCAGYYRYDEGFTPDLPGTEDFAGTIVHPQLWPDDLDYTGQRVVVIGSGATAVTLVPAMADRAAHVTMLQRSPTYISAVPTRDPLAERLSRLPARLAYPLVRWKNVLAGMAVFQLSRRRPELLKFLLRRGAVAQLPAGYAVDTHFAPAYNPWDQRLCAAPGGDFFAAIRSGTADVVTGQIERLTPTGIRLTTGEDVPADLIVTATGLNLLVIGGLALSVDGRDIDLPRTVTYKGMMLAGVPNFALTVGYTNASWTLKADLVARYVCRLLKHLDASGYRTVTPVPPDLGDPDDLAPLIDFQSGYVLRALSVLPKQGPEAPWRMRQNYLQDVWAMRHGPITDAVRFGHAGAATSEEDRDESLSVR